MTRWAISATVMAERAYTDRFVDHHVRLGASEINLVFDHDDFCDYTPRTDVDLRIHHRGARYYRQNAAAERPQTVADRVVANFLDIRTTSAADWIALVDVDELIWSAEPVERVLERQPDTVFSIAMPPLEAIYVSEPRAGHGFSTSYFKRALPEFDIPDALMELYEALHRDLAPMMRFGLFGHKRGKSIMRTGVGFASTDGHEVNTTDPALRTGVVVDGLELLHFESLDFATWKTRWLRRRQGGEWTERRHRRGDLRNLIIETVDKGDKDALVGLYRRMCVASPETIEAGRRAGVIVERQVPGMSGAALSDRSET